MESLQQIGIAALLRCLFVGLWSIGDSKTNHSPLYKPLQECFLLRIVACEKKLRFLRRFLNWATEKGYNTNMAYKSFKPTLKTTQKKVIYLTKEEMARVRNLQLSGAQAYLDPIRDVFLFCCFSGLRHSDANNLRRSDIKSGHIEVTTVKTADSISIELNDVTKAILEKYKDAPFNDNKALPNVVMKWTGHSDYSSMKPYIDIVDSIKASSMTKLNGLL